MDVCGAAFIAIGLDRLERDGFTLFTVGNFALGLFVGLSGIFWKALSKKLPERLVSTAIQTATDFRWWLILILSAGAYLALAHQPREANQEAALAPAIYALGVQQVPNFSDTTIGMNAIFQVGPTGTMRDGTEIGDVVLEDHRLSSKEEDALFDGLDTKMASMPSNFGQLNHNLVLYQTFSPPSFSKQDNDDVLAGRRYLYVIAQVRYSIDADTSSQ